MNDEETKRDTINDFRAGIIGITNKNVTMFINYAKTIKDCDLLASIYWSLSLYYFNTKCYNECVKFLKLYQNVCRDGHDYISYYFLSECYIKLGNLEEGIAAFENFFIKYKKDNEQHGVPPLGCFNIPINRFSKNLKFSKGRFKSKW